MEATFTKTMVVIKAKASSSTKIATVVMGCSFKSVTWGEMLVCSNISLY